MKPLLVLLSFFPAAALAAPACENLAHLSLPNVAVLRAESVSAGTFTPPEGKPVAGLPAFCRVHGILKPSSDSNIQFEVWMPESGWNGKFLGVGNGGFAGSIGFGQLGLVLARRYATAATDTGHEAGGVNAEWALGHPEKIADFGYRAIHETAVTAKRLIAAFYGKPAQHTYFNSCSNGGRQALMEAQRFPEDYDGIVAGAPANYWTHLLSNGAWDTAALGSPGGYIPQSKLPAIEKAALQACDARDGVKDGVIEDPPRCHFDPSVLACRSGDSDTCLTPPQLTTLKKLYSGARFLSGKPVYPGYLPGGEAEPGGWAVWITGPVLDRALIYGFSTQFFKNMVYSDPSWDFHKFDPDRDTAAADTRMAKFLNATDPDLHRFAERGGKLILYHGWSDAAISARNTVNYFNSVTDKMGAAATSRFVRLYLVPGMQHCAGGPGPADFGQFRAPDGDATHDIGSALERWVEQGAPPAEIVAVNDKNKASHPLCPYPEIARYRGSGSTTDEANFACVKP